MRCYHREPDAQGDRQRRAAVCLTPIAACMALIAGACASAPTASRGTPTVPVITWEQKIGWMVRLEDQRILRDPNPPAPVVLKPATQREPALVAPVPPSDLIKLLNDPEARVRRRAALAIGRVGLSEGVEPLTKLLDDPEIEVRQMAAFGLGLIGDPSARPVLLAALKDPQPVLQGRAAEALGQIGDRADAEAIGAMVQAHIKSGALTGLAPDDLTYPLSAPAETARLGLYALARLGAYDALAAAVLVNGQPVSTWWPVAYALQRVGDPRAAPALMALVNTPGRFTASFAVKGLGSSKATRGGARSATDRRAAEACSTGRHSGGAVSRGDSRCRRGSRVGQDRGRRVIGPDAASRSGERVQRARHRRASQSAARSHFELGARHPRSSPAGVGQGRSRHLPHRAGRPRRRSGVERASGDGECTGHTAIGAEPAPSDGDAAGPGSESDFRSARRAGLVQGIRCGPDPARSARQPGSLRTRGRGQRARGIEDCGRRTTAGRCVSPSRH